MWDWNEADDSFTKRWRDEFKTLDLSRWIVSNNMSYESNSSRFHAPNTFVKNGKLVLEMTKANYVDKP